VIQKVFGGQQNFDALVSSQKVIAQMLHRWDDEKADPWKLNGYILDPPILLTSAQAQQIQHLLQTPSSYKFSRTEKSCVVDYGVLFTFYSSQQTVRVALCFKCDMLGVFNGEDDNRESVNSETDFDPVHGQFVAIAKSIFPNDPTIQSLKEKQH
jgi:hypothetical protein